MLTSHHRFVLSGGCTRLDGRTPPADRTLLVRKFNSGEGGRVFLLSVRAGGAGLTLVGANRLVMLDTDWDPALDTQVWPPL